MYYYIYDSFLEEKKEYARFLAKIETQVNNLGLTGERTRVTSIKKIDQLVIEAVDKKYDPIIIVGHDDTFSAAASALAKYGSEVRLAFVPIDGKSMIAELLGVTPQNAVIILSRRIVKSVPLASANGHHFLAQVNCELRPDNSTFNWFSRLRKKSQQVPFRPELLLDNNYLIKSHTTSVEVYPGFSIKRLKIKLNLISEQGWRKKPKLEKSIFWPLEAKINCKHPVPVIIDGRKVSRTPLNIKLTNSCVNLIVGPQRRFP